MKRIIKVSACDFALKYTSSHYIHDYNQYGIKCDIVSRDLGIFRDKYVLKLEGAPEDIQLYQDYLKCSGFKIH